MTTNHEPRAEFVQRLEERVSAEARRRTVPGVARVPRWMPRSPLTAAAALAAVVIVSMTLGGAVVAARYEAQENQQRALIVANIERRIELALEKVTAAKKQVDSVQQRVSTGVESREALAEARVGLDVAEVQVRILQLQLEEARVSGREPQEAVSTPPVAPRDYLYDRMQVQLVASMAALDLERTRLSSTQLRANVGLATQLELAAARTRVVEVELALRAQQQKISIRREFTAGQIDGPMAELRVLEVEATQRLETIRPKLDMAGKLLKDLQTNVEIGTSAPFDLQEAKLRMAQLELDLRKAELDFMIVRKQIDQRKGK